MKKVFWTVGVCLFGCFVGGMAGGRVGVVVGLIWGASIGYGFGAIFTPKRPTKGLVLQLKLFRICRSPGWMLDTVPDMFVARTSFPQLKHAEDFLRSLGLEPESPFGILNGIPFSLHRASRDDWNDIWFQVATGSDCSAPLTTIDFERASELEIFLLTLPSLKWIDPPWDTERCICPKYYPEVFEKSGRDTSTSLLR